MTVATEVAPTSSHYAPVATEVAPTSSNYAPVATEVAPTSSNYAPVATEVAPTSSSKHPTRLNSICGSGFSRDESHTRRASRINHIIPHFNIDDSQRLTSARTGKTQPGIHFVLRAMRRAQNRRFVLA